MVNRITEMTAAATLTGNELLEVSQLSPTVTLTGTTLSAAASDNSINDSGSGFLAAGFAAGDRVSITGFATSGNNLFFGVVATAAAGKLVILAPEGDALADEAAGASVTVTKWTTRRTTSQGIAALAAGGSGSGLDIENEGVLVQLGATILNFTGDGVTASDDGGYVVEVNVPGSSAPFEMTIACSDETTALTTGAGKVTFRMPAAVTLTAVRASVTTAPTGSVLTVDINEGGASILSTKLTIDVSEKTSTTAATPAVISDTALADDAEITIDIDTVGSTIAGAGLKVTLIGTRT